MGSITLSLLTFIFPATFFLTLHGLEKSGQIKIEWVYLAWFR